MSVEEAVDQAVQECINKGNTLKEGIFRMFERNRTPEEISVFTGVSLDYLYGVKQEYLMVREKTSDYNVKK